MTEEIEIYDRRTDHGKRAALMRLRLVEEAVIPLLEELAVIAGAVKIRLTAHELSAAIDGVVNLMRQMPPEARNEQ